MTYVRLLNPQDQQTTNVILFGANFDDDYPLKNLYKALNVVRPDALLLQISPDIAMKDFSIEKACAQEHNYQDMIKVDGADLLPSDEYREQIRDFLRKSGLMFKSVEKPEMEATADEGKDAREKISSDFLQNTLSTPLRLTMESIATASLWHEANGRRCDLYLADIPYQLHKNKIMNSLHLIELEESFQTIAYHKGEYDNLYNSALNTTPDLMLHHSDEFLAATINLVSKGKRNLFVVCGTG